MFSQAYTQTIDIVLWVFLVFGFAFAVTVGGIGRVFATLVASALTVVAIEFIAQTTLSQNLIEDAFGILAALVVGMIGGIVYRYRTPQRIRDAVNLRINEIVSDYRILLVIAALFVAILVTTVFGNLATLESPRGFWHGFYEAWTASIVFFSILGIAGTIVSLYRPEKDEFEARVRILCGGRSGPEVDYIREVIRKIGYFGEAVKRTYSIKSWDPVRRAYEIEVRHESVNKNYFDDEEPDIGAFSLTPDQLNPTLDPIGSLIEVLVDSASVCGAEYIPVTGLSKEWAVRIKRGGEARIVLRHKLWYSVDKVHNFRPARFAKSATVEIVSEVPSITPLVSGTVYQRKSPDLRTGASPTELPFQENLSPSLRYVGVPSAINCLPDKIAISLKFDPP